jgi:prepilin-type processing-associated H-X9-DG protein
VIEHLPDRHLPTHFRQMFRALRPGGGIRVGGPDVGTACARLVAGDLGWFSTFPVARKSSGGRFANFVFCDGEHLTALSESYLRELAEAAGFVEIRRMLPCRESGLVGREVLDLEYENDFEHPHTVIIEARKPR